MKICHPCKFSSLNVRTVSNNVHNFTHGIAEDFFTVLRHPGFVLSTIFLLLHRVVISESYYDLSNESGSCKFEHPSTKHSVNAMPKYNYRVQLKNKQKELLTLF